MAKDAYAKNRIKIGAKRFMAGEKITGLDKPEYKELARLDLVEFKKPVPVPEEPTGGVTETDAEKPGEGKKDDAKKDAEKTEQKAGK